MPHLTLDGRVSQVICTFSDISDRRRAEDALRLTEERFAKAFRASPIPIAISRKSDGRIIEVNDSWIRLFGYNREESLGRTAIELNLYSDLVERQRLLSGGREDA